MDAPAYNEATLTAGAKGKSATPQAPQGWWMEATTTGTARRQRTPFDVLNVNEELRARGGSQREVPVSAGRSWGGMKLYRARGQAILCYATVARDRRRRWEAHDTTQPPEPNCVIGL